MRGKGARTGTPSGLRLTSLSMEDAAQMLTKGGGVRMTAADLQADVDAGAPLNPDGTISLIVYTAWLVRELSDGD